MAIDVPEYLAALQAKTGQKSLLDPDIIEWLHERNGVWIHADDRAKVEHKKLITTKNVRTLWVHRPNGKLGTREQIRILSFVLPDLLRRFEDQPKTRHYSVRTVGTFPKDSPRLRAIDLAKLRIS